MKAGRRGKVTLNSDWRGKDIGTEKNVSLREDTFGGGDETLQKIRNPSPGEGYGRCRKGESF